MNLLPYKIKPAENHQNDCSIIQKTRPKDNKISQGKIISIKKKNDVM